MQPLPIYTDENNAEALRKAGADGSVDSWLKAHFSRLGAGDYVALLAYLARDEANAAHLQPWRLGVARPAPRRDLPRIRSALSAFDRPGLQRRTRQRRVPPDHGRRRQGPRHSGPPRELRRDQGRAGARRFRRSARARPPRAARPSQWRSRSPASSRSSAADPAHSERKGSTRHADRHDRSRPDGRQYRPPPDAARPRGGRLRSATPRRSPHSAATAPPARPDWTSSCSKLRAPRAVWVMLPAGKITEDVIAELGKAAASGRRRHRRRQHVLEGRHPPRQNAQGARHPSRRCRHHRRRLGTRARLLHDDRRRQGRSSTGSIRSSRRWRRASAISPRTPGREGRDPRAEQGYIHAGPIGAGHFVKMVHNGIEYGLMQAYAEGFDILKNANSDALPEDTRFDLDLADIAEVWRRGSVITSWLLDLTATALAERPEARRFRRRGRGFRRRPLDRQWPRSTRRCRPTCCTAALYARFRSRTRAHLCGKDPLGDAQGLRRPCRAESGRRPQGQSVMTAKRPSRADRRHKARPADPCCLVIFGASGDLTHRLLVPALYNLAVDGPAAGSILP